MPWRDLPERYGPWETVYKRLARWQTDGTLARIEAALLVEADGAGELDWDAQVDSSVIRAHQHAAGARKGGLGSIQASRQQALGRSRGGLTPSCTPAATVGAGTWPPGSLRGRTPAPASWSGWWIRCGWPGRAAAADPASDPIT